MCLLTLIVPSSHLRLMSVGRSLDRAKLPSRSRHLWLASTPRGPDMAQVCSGSMCSFLNVFFFSIEFVCFVVVLLLFFLQCTVCGLWCHRSILHEYTFMMNHERITGAASLCSAWVEEQGFVWECRKTLSSGGQWYAKSRLSCRRGRRRTTAKINK